MTEQDKKTLIKLWNDRVSATKIAQLLPYPLPTIRHTIDIYKRYGILVESNRIDKKEDRVLQAYKNGMTDIEELADSYEIGVPYVRAILTRNGIRFPRKKGYTKKPCKIRAEKQAMIDELKSGKSQVEVARQFGHTRQYISQIYRQYVKEAKNDI